MKSKLAKTKIAELKNSKVVNRNDLICRIRLSCEHDEGFQDGYCKGCEFNEIYLAESHKMFLAGERFDIGLISHDEYWDIVHNDETWRYINERLEYSLNEST